MIAHESDKLCSQGLAPCSSLLEGLLLGQFARWKAKAVPMQSKKQALSPPHSTVRHQSTVGGERLLVRFGAAAGVWTIPSPSHAIIALGAGLSSGSQSRGLPLALGLRSMVDVVG